MERNEELERLVLEAPEDLGLYSVYGDWLTERGDPRGELVAVQIARSDPSRSLDQGLRWQEEYLLREHREKLLGPLASSEPWIRVEHTLGFFGKLVVSAITIEDGTFRDEVFQRFVDALASPEGSFVHTLQLDLVRPGGDLERALWLLAEGGPYPAVREVTFATNESAYQDLRALWTTFPRLRKLTLRNPRVQLGTPVAPELEELVISPASWLMLPQYEGLFTAPLPRLRSLVIDAPRPYIAEALRELFAGRNTPRLRSLAIMQSDDSFMLAQRLAQAPLLTQLRVLDLSGGNLGDDDARVLARSGRLCGLARLVVNDNDLSPDGIALLREACPNVVSDMQHDDYGEQPYDYE